MLGKMQQVSMEAPLQPSKPVFRVHETTVFRNGPGPSKVEKLIQKAALLELILVPTVAKLHKMMLKTCVDKCVDTCVDTCVVQGGPGERSNLGKLGWHAGKSKIFRFWAC